MRVMVLQSGVKKTEKTQIITVLAMGAVADSSMGVMSAVPVDWTDTHITRYIIVLAKHFLFVVFFEKHKQR